MKYSVRTKLIAVMLVIFAAAAAAYSFISYSSAKRSAEAVVISLIEQSAVSAAETLSGKIEAVTAVCDDLSDNDAAFNRAVDEIRLRLLDMRNESYLAEGMTFDIAYSDELVSINGITDYSQNEAVRSAAAGTPLMTAPYVCDGQSVVCYASPLSEPYDERRCVLVCTVCCGFFDDVFGVISLGESCAVYVTDENGAVAGKASESDKVYSASAPVEKRNGWTVWVEAVPEELMPDLTAEILKAVLFSAVLAAALSTVTAAVLGRTLSPVKKLAERISALADGDFTSPVPDVRTNDESREIAGALDKTIAALKGCVDEAAAVISSVADGDISENKDVYSGDFALIYGAVSDVKRSMRKTFSQVREISDSVIDGAERLSAANAAGDFASGIPQENTVGEIFAEQTGICADILSKAGKASESIAGVKEMLSEEREKLGTLTETISAVNGYTGDITGVISQIDDIAFRTNILALNAAVEAAAAGVHGRSFAVVADEVRALAQRSSEAAKSTENIIKNTVSALSGGALIAGETMRVLDEADGRADTAGELVSGLRADAEKYASSAAAAENALAKFSAEAAASAVPAGTEEAEAVVSEARRLRGVADVFKFK
ncbi:MAG: methyl-accepting chemotaxis protein [Eubacterium sp.]|nr:methyl-accepting chemotaxis protein [Eubacterium sp.]